MSITIETKRPTALPPRIVLYGVGGVGKTSLSSYFPKPIFMMSPGETGVEELIGSGQIDNVPRFPEVKTWEENLDQIDFLFASDHKYKTLVVDVAPGMLHCLHEQQCEKEYKGDWGPKGFGAYRQGERECTPIWHNYLLTLDKVRDKKHMTIILLAHCEIKNFKNPLGADYDRYRPAMSVDDWNNTFAWCDMCLFMNYDLETKRASDRDGKDIGSSGDTRFLYTQRSAAYDAKGGRRGLPAEIELPNDAKLAYDVFVETMKNAKKDPVVTEKKGSE